MGNISPNGGRKKRIYYGCGRKGSRGSKKFYPIILKNLYLILTNVF
jgi:hypothetical protein